MFSRAGRSNVSVSLLLLFALLLAGSLTGAPRSAHAGGSTIQINSGDGDAAPFVADTDYNGGQTASTSSSIDTSGVSNPAPQTVYQSERYGNFTYTVPGLTAGASYTVRLHFAEIYWSAAGQRVFNVAINGTQVLNNFDIYATAGGSNKAIVETFSTTADSNGQITIDYSTVVDNAKSSGIEILGSNTTTTNCGSASGGPTDNPIATRYGSATYSWTDTIQWSCVYNVNDYSGSDLEKFNAARDAAAANGGGVVYFPAGTYTFNDNLVLKSGVVIRGDAPGTNNATDSSYAPPSKLVFPQYVPNLSGNGTDDTTAFKHIYTTNPKSDSNIGIVNLDINRAGIELVETHAVRFSSAFDPTTYTGQNIIVFGVRDNNAAVPYGAPDTPSGVPASWQNAWQRAPFPFEANIDVLAKANVLIANNRLNDLSQSGQDDSFDQPGYLYKNTNNAITAASGGLGQGRFDYANIYGISLNGTYLFSRGDTTFPNGWYATNDPNDTSHPYRPYLFASGNVIRDNWIFHDEGQAIEASGSGLTITGNIIRDIPTANKDMYINNSGQKAPSGSTFSTRGILMGGQDIDVENNDIQAYQWLINGGPYTTNDAENLLWDNTTTLVNGWTVKNNTLTGLVSNFYDQDINNVTISNNTWVSGGGNSIWETADTSSTQFYALNNVHVENNTNVIGTVIMEGHAGGSNNSFIGNSAASSGTAFNYTTASSISIDGNNNFSLNPEN